MIGEETIYHMIRASMPEWDYLTHMKCEDVASTVQEHKLSHTWIYVIILFLVRYEQNGNNTKLFTNLHCQVSFSKTTKTKKLLFSGIDESNKKIQVPKLTLKRPNSWTVGSTFWISDIDFDNKTDVLFYTLNKITNKNEHVVDCANLLSICMKTS